MWLGQCVSHEMWWKLEDCVAWIECVSREIGGSQRTVWLG